MSENNDNLNPLCESLICEEKNIHQELLQKKEKYN